MIPVGRTAAHVGGTDTVPGVPSVAAWTPVSATRSAGVGLIATRAAAGVRSRCLHAKPDPALALDASTRALDARSTAVALAIQGDRAVDADVARDGEQESPAPLAVPVDDRRVGAFLDPDRVVAGVAAEQEWVVRTVRLSIRALVGVRTDHQIRDRDEWGQGGARGWVSATATRIQADAVLEADAAIATMATGRLGPDATRATDRRHGAFREVDDARTYVDAAAAAATTTARVAWRPVRKPCRAIRIDAPGHDDGVGLDADRATTRATGPAEPLRLRS